MSHVLEKIEGIQLTNRIESGLILAISTPSSLKLKDKEIYFVHSESRLGIRYQVNFEDGTCADFKNRGETCKHFYKIVMERAIA